MSLGERLLELRRGRKLSQTQLVTLLRERHGVEMTRANYSFIEGDVHKHLPDAKTLSAMATVLHTTTADLLITAGYLDPSHIGMEHGLPVTRRMDRLSDYAPWVQEVLLSQLDTGMDVLDRQFGSDMQRTLCQMAAQIGPEETDLIQRLEEITLAHESHQRRGNESNDAQLSPGEAEPVPVQDAVRTEGDL